MYYLLSGITSKFKLLEINFKLPEIFSLGKKAIKIKESLKIMLIFFMFDSVFSPPSLDYFFILLPQVFLVNRVHLFIKLSKFGLIVNLLDPNP
jgi:hypothetical protein